MDGPGPLGHSFRVVGSAADFPAVVWLPTHPVDEGRRDTVTECPSKAVHSEGCSPKATTGHCCLNQCGINTRHSQATVASAAIQQNVSLITETKAGNHPLNRGSTSPLMLNMLDNYS